MVTARLNHASLRAGHSATAAGDPFDARRAAEFAGDDNEDAFVESARVNVFDQCGDCLVEIGSSELQGIKNVVIDRVIIPICHPTAKRPIQSGGNNFDAGLDKSPGHQALLSPLMAP